MTRTIVACSAALASCAAPPPPGSSPAPPPPPRAAACASPEHRQLDFWLGDWNAAIRSRAAPDGDAWKETRGENHIRSVLGGCAVEESFSGDPTGQPWAGKSHSAYVPALQGWRQTWVDDQGSYLAFRGGVEGATFVLYGEPRDVQGKTVQMRMVFGDIARDSFTWTWERGTPGGASWTPMMVIHYTRK